MGRFVYYPIRCERHSCVYGCALVCIACIDTFWDGLLDNWIKYTQSRLQLFRCVFTLALVASLAWRAPASRRFLQVRLGQIYFPIQKALAHMEWISICKTLIFVLQYRSFFCASPAPAPAPDIHLRFIGNYQHKSAYIASRF